MNPKLTQKTALFVENVNIIRKDKNLKRIRGLDNRAVSFLYAAHNQKIDRDIFMNSFTLFGNNYSLSSILRSTRVLYTGAALSLEKDSSAVFEQFKVVIELMGEAGFLADSNFIGVAAYLIATRAEPADYQSVVERAYGYYNEFKKRPHFLASESQYPYMALFGLSDIDVSDGLMRLEQLYQQYMSRLPNASQTNIQNLVEVLFLIGEDEDRILSSINALEKIKRPDRFSMFTAGYLSSIPKDAGTLADEINEMQKYLRKQRGFKLVSKVNLYLAAAALVANTYASEGSPLFDLIIACYFAFAFNPNVNPPRQEGSPVTKRSLN